MRIFWTILGIAGGLVLLLLIAVAIAVWTIDVNQFVGPIQARVKSATGRDLAIAGRVDLDLGLVPKVVANDIRFGNAPWAREPQMLTAKRVEVEVALLPLLQRRFELVRLNLVEPVIALETDAHGKGNWEFGAAGGGAAGAAAAAGSPAAALAAFGVGSVEITNGLLTYRDGTSDALTRVAIDRFAAQARTPASPINAEFTGKIDDVPVALTGNLGPLEMFLARQAPYPVTVEGKVGEQKTKLATKVRIGEKAVQFDDVDLGVGSSKAKGQALVATGGPRPKISLTLASTTLSLSDLVLPVGVVVGVPRVAEKAAQSGRVFNDDPVSFAALRSVDVDGDISIGELQLRNGGRLGQVRALFTVKDGRLDAPDLTASIYGGTVRAALAIDATHAADPTLALSVDAKGLDLAALFAAAGTPREVKGGKTDVAMKLAMHGTTPRQWASDVSGTVTAIVGPATVTNSKLDPALPLNQLAQTVNPFRDRAPTTELVCAVVRVPLHGGVAHIDRSLAAESRELGVAASGTLDLRAETVDLSFAPRVKQGIPINIAEVADLVHLRGPLASPKVEVDAGASAAAIARLGAAARGGGLAALGAAMLAPAPDTGPGVCDVALGKATAPAAAAATTPAQEHVPAGVPADLGKALGQLLHR